MYRSSPIEEVSIPAIVEAAGISTGAFYSRFPSRLALTQVLHERFYADADALLNSLIGEVDFVTAEWPSVFRRLIETTMELFRQHRGFMNAAFYHTRMQPDPDCLERARTGNKAILGRVAEILLCRRSEIGHPNPELGLAISLEWMTTAVRESVVFGRTTEFTPLATDEQLVDELVRMMLAHLDVPGLP